jgi:hypothetical protein
MALETGDVENRLATIERGLSELSQLPPGAEKPARALFESLLDLYGLTLTTLAAALTRTTEGVAAFDQLADTEPVRAVLLLHGLHPVPTEKRARRAVDRMRPEILSHGCHLGPVEISAGVLRVWLHGRDAPVMSTILRNAILDAAPDLGDTIIEVSAADDPAGERLSA